MLPQGLWLKISFLWFQSLKNDGYELQKSNAAMRVNRRDELELERKLFRLRPAKHA